MMRRTSFGANWVSRVPSRGLWINVSGAAASSLAMLAAANGFFAAIKSCRRTRSELSSGGSFRGVDRASRQQALRPALHRFVVHGPSGGDIRQRFQGEGVAVVFPLDPIRQSLVDDLVPRLVQPGRDIVELGGQLFRDIGSYGFHGDLPEPRQPIGKTPAAPCRGGVRRAGGAAQSRRRDQAPRG